MGPQLTPSWLSTGEQTEDKLRHVGNTASLEILSQHSSSPVFVLNHVGKNGSWEFGDTLYTLFCPLFTLLVSKIWPRCDFVQKVFSESRPGQGLLVHITEHPEPVHIITGAVLKGGQAILV